MGRQREDVTMFDFPASPAPGQSYNPAAGGPSYAWDGTAWRMTSGGVNSGVFIGDTPPPNPVHGQLWWESDTGNTFIYYQDANSGQWVQFNIQGGTAGYAQTKNRIVNPAFQIAQEQVSTTTNGGYFADQWQAGFVGGGTATFSRPLSVAGDANPRHQGRLLIGTADAAIAAGDYLYMMHNIEAACIADFMWGTAAALPAVLRFTGLAVNAASAGTYYVSVRSGDGGVSFVAPFTLTTSWQEFVIPVPPCSIGNWPIDNSRGLMLTFAFAAGASFHTSPNQWISGGFTAAAGISNGWGTAANDFRIAKVGLYLDPENTGKAPPWETPDEAEEFRVCQRYWQSVSSYLSAALTPGSSSMLPVVMRSTPAWARTGGAGTSGMISGNTIYFYQSVANSVAALVGFSANARM
jgi:hypothetical protein